MNKKTTFNIAASGSFIKKFKINFYILIVFSFICSSDETMAASALPAS